MNQAEKILEDIAQVLVPLEAPALSAVLELVKMLVTHESGVELAAKRAGEALAAKAAIRS